MYHKVSHGIASVLLALALAFANFNPALAAPPGNDDFNSPTVISALPYTDTVNISEATSDEANGEPQYCTYSPQTVWYSFTATTNTLLQVDLQGSDFYNTTVTIYQVVGPGYGGLAFITCNSFFGTATFNAQAGTTYYLQGGSASGGGNNLHLSLQEILPPANDNFDSSTTISALPFNDSVNNMAATTEAGEPQSCGGAQHSVWYIFTPSANAIVHADMSGSNFGDTMLTLFQSTGPGFGGLSFLRCASFGNFINFEAQVGTTYYIQAATNFSVGGDLELHLYEVPPPVNDNFSNATIIPSSLPFSDTIDISAATVEPNEPSPSCAAASQTAWYRFTANTTGSLSARSNDSVSMLALYTGSALGSLTEIGCRPYYFQPLTFRAVAGTTYYFQLGAFQNTSGMATLHLEVAPLPQANFYYFPGDPSKYDTIQFGDNSYDPGNAGFQTGTWNFGDGTNASGFSASHRYAADGNYTVSHTVTTIDGRTGSVTQTVQVRTHDVAVTKVTAPTSANVGQTRTITVNVRNSNYPETAQIDLYKSSPNGFVLVASLPNKPVPALSGNRTTSFSFNYTFTSSDANMGKVTFQVIVSLQNARDALSYDNQLVSTPPTKVTR